MPLPITFDDILKALQNTKQEDLTSLAERIATVPNWAENFDLTTHRERLRRLREAMTPEEASDPTIIDSRRQVQIAAQSGLTADQVEDVIQMFRRLRNAGESMLPIGLWQFLGFSRFRPPDRA